MKLRTGWYRTSRLAALSKALKHICISIRPKTKAREKNTLDRSYQIQTSKSCYFKRFWMKERNFVLGFSFLSHKKITSKQFWGEYSSVFCLNSENIIGPHKFLNSADPINTLQEHILESRKHKVECCIYGVNKTNNTQETLIFEARRN